MKINLDGFVPYGDSQSYKCARGCSGCTSSKRKDVPALRVDMNFYWLLEKFIEYNHITYESISFNFCWDFLYNYNDFLNSIRFLSQKNILKKWLKILCYTNQNSIWIHQNKIHALRHFQSIFHFQIGIPLLLDENLDSIDKQIQSIRTFENKINHSNTSIHIVIQRSFVSFSESIRRSLFEKIHPLLVDFKLTWAESEGIYMDESALRNWLFLPPLLSQCPFVENDWINVENDEFYFYMLDISNQGIRPHGPGCEKNPHLYIGTVNDSAIDLKNNANKLKIALQKMNNEYDKTQTIGRDICSFCRKNIQLFT